MSLLDGFRKRIAEPQQREERADGPVSDTTRDPSADTADPTPATATAQAADPPESAATETSASRDGQGIHDDVVSALKTVYDPEIPVDIYELGLIYEVDVRQGSVVYVQMTLTSPMCPVAESLPIEVEAKVRSVQGVGDVELDLVWDPPWEMDMMSEAAKLELNML